MANVADKQPSQLRAFISYSRVDSRFVDRLDADLNARNIKAWVERRKIQGGTDWLQEIQESIERCDVFLLVLSPDMLKSRWVRMEYTHALTLNKPIIPLLLRPVEKVPLGINAIQWVTAFEQDYDVGLNELLIILGNHVEKPPSINVPIAAPPPVQMINDQDWDAELVQARPAPAAPERDLRDLYRAGMQAKARNDLDRTSLYWQQVIDKDARFGDGVLASELEKVNAALVPIRIGRLRKRANHACQMRLWGEEIGAWEALLKLAPNDEEGEKALAIAEQNQKHAWFYEEARGFYAQKDFESMRAQLELLYQLAPQFGDPDKLAKGQNIKVPLSRLQLSRRHSSFNLLNQPMFLTWRLMWWLTFEPMEAVEYFRQFADEGVHYYKTLTTMLVIILSAVWLIPLSAASLGIAPLSGTTRISNGFALVHWLIAAISGCGVILYMCSTLIRTKADAEKWIKLACVVACVVAFVVACVVAFGVAGGGSDYLAISMGVVVASVAFIVSGARSGNVVGRMVCSMTGGVAGSMAGAVMGGVAVFAPIVGAVSVAFIVTLGVADLFSGFMNRMSNSISGGNVEKIRLHLGVMISFVGLWISYLVLIWTYWLGGWRMLPIL